MASNAVNSPQTVTVSLKVIAATGTRAPFGAVDTPVNNATAVAGAVGVTGWALDDVEVVKVDVWRNALPGEPKAPNGHIYIGDALFVEGARPDVAGEHPSVPFNTRAGWGMQVLTNMLPNTLGPGPRGNGTYQLFVYAHDREGKSTLLGSPRITVNNEASTKPFGTIDSPGNGESVSGAAVVNAGWALTPQPGVIPAEGSTIQVLVDGMPLGHAVYGTARGDVAALLPGYENSEAAGAYFSLDTLGLANGMHTIAWVVTDSLGRAEGIGSRFFSVLNAGAAIQSMVPSSKAAEVRAARREGVWVRTGYDLDAPLRPMDGGVVEVEQGGRVELHVPAGVASATLGEAGTLPAGSVLDVRSGVFYWHLPPVYVASYGLVFRDAQGTEVCRVVVRVDGPST
jgi:hypothetical protein